MTGATLQGAEIQDALVADDLRTYGDVSLFTYLEDSGVELPGLRVWGSPWQPEYNALVYVLSGNGTVGAEARPFLDKTTPRAASARPLQLPCA